MEVKLNNQVAYKVFFAFVPIYELPITMIALPDFRRILDSFLSFRSETMDKVNIVR